MGIKENIIEELKNSNKTAKELSENLNTHLNTIKSTITRMKKAELIVIVGTKDKFSIYALNPDKVELNCEKIVEWLAFLDNMFKENVDYLLQNPEIVETVMSNEETFNNITKVCLSVRKKSS